MIQDINELNWQKTIEKYSENNKNILFINDVIKTTNFLLLQDNELVICSNSQDNINMLNNCKIELEKIYNEISNLNVNIKFILMSEKNQFLNSKQNLKIENNIDPNITFKNYVIGDFNKNAFKLMNHICENGTSLFTPIFINGKTGLGKTHLVLATINELKNKFPNKNVHYVEAQTFLKEIFKCFEDKNSSSLIEKLKETYSNYDVLIIDDVQYFADKTKSNEILFTIFNNLTKTKKIIILTADKPPHELNGFEERMISRFSSGISCKIDNPEESALEEITKITLQSQNKNIEITENANMMISNFCDKDIRKLLGVINKILFFVEMKNNDSKVLDQDEIKTILEIDNQIIGRDRKSKFVSNSKIIEIVAKTYNIKIGDLSENSRKKNIVLARHVVMYIMREYNKLNLKDIGHLLGNRDHTTVLSGVEKIKSLIIEDKEFGKLINSIVKKLTI